MGSWKDAKRDKKSLEKQLAIVRVHNPISIKEFAKGMWPDHSSWKNTHFLRSAGRYEAGVAILLKAKQQLDSLVKRKHLYKIGPVTGETEWEAEYILNEDIPEPDAPTISVTTGPSERGAVAVIGHESEVEDPGYVKVQISSVGDYFLIYNWDKSVLYESGPTPQLRKLFPKREGWPAKKYFKYHLDYDESLKSNTIVLGEQVPWREW